MPESSATTILQLQPLAAQYIEREAIWRRFIGRHLPGAVCVRWGCWHRVYRHGGRAVKVQRMEELLDDVRQHVKSEFALLEAMERRVWSLHPTYREIDSAWAVLEMDWIEGVLASDLVAEGRGREISAPGLLAKLIRVSLAGVVHRQFRARHILRHRDGTLFLIDFGGSYRTSPLIALWRNLAPLEYAGSRWLPRGVAVTIWQLLFGKRLFASQSKDRRVAAMAMRRWMANGKRRPSMRADGLPSNLGSSVTTDNLERMETALHKVIDEDPQIVAETWRILLGSYVLYGNRDWGLFWDRVAALTDLAGKRVVDIGCGLGPIGTFARIHGAAAVVSLDDRPQLLNAAHRFAESLGVAGNDYRPLDWNVLSTGDTPLPPGDLVTVLSARADRVPFERMLDILSKYPEAIYETERPESAASGLAARGFTQVKIIGRSYGNRYFVYARRDG